MPVISVITSAYNAGQFVGEAIQSILNQSFTDFEFIIYNDGSTDNTDEVIRSFDDSRIVYISRENNVGMVTLAKDGIKISRGKYIARMDADDISMPTRFEDQVSFLNNHLEIGICGTWYENFGDMEGAVQFPQSAAGIKYSLFFGTPFGQPTVMMRKDLLEKYDLEYNNDFFATEDYDLFERASVFFDLANIPKVLLKYRKHSSQLTFTRWQQQYHMAGLIQARRFLRALKSYNNYDKKWLENYFTEKSVPVEGWFEEIGLYKKRVIDDNLIKMIYPHEIVTRAANELFAEVKTKKNIKAYYFRKYYQQKDYNIQLLQSFVKEKYKPYKYFGIKESLRFLIKCVVHYNNKNTLQL